MTELEESFEQSANLISMKHDFSKTSEAATIASSTVSKVEKSSCSFVCDSGSLYMRWRYRQWLTSILCSYLSPQLDNLSFHFRIARPFSHSFEVLIDLAVETETLASAAWLIGRTGTDHIAT